MFDDALRARALYSIATRRDDSTPDRPSPHELETRHVKAWSLYTEAGVPGEPGIQAASDALDRAGKDTHAMREMVRVDPSASGTVVLAGGVGSGRSYAAARWLWRQAQRAAHDRDTIVGRWVDSADLGQPTMREWGARRAALSRPHVMVLDDMGAAGMTKVVESRGRELVEARHRGPGGRQRLTVITTNAVTDAALAQLLGGRLKDRAVIVQVSGGSMRRPALTTELEEPSRITQARKRLSMVAHLDMLARGRTQHPGCLEPATAWLGAQGAWSPPQRG